MDGGSHEGPVDEHEGEAVRRVVVAKNLPRHRLLIRCLPPHARLADASREIGETLLHDLGELQAQRLPALVIQDHLERDVLEVDQRRLKDVEAGIVGEGEHRSRLQRTAQYCVAVLPQERQGRIGIFGIRPTDICSGVSPERSTEITSALTSLITTSDVAMCRWF